MMRNILSCLAAIGLLVISTLAQDPTAGYGNQYCPRNLQLPAQNSTPTPPLPSLPSTFQTTIAVIIADKNISLSAQEYYDGTSANLASLIVTKQGSTYKLLMDYPNNQIFYIDQLSNQCQVKNLTTDNNNVLFGDTFQNGKMHIFTSNGVLHFSQKSGQVYMGQTTVRGINCFHWRSCMYWPSLNASKFAVDYYFTADSWIPASNYPNTPVRAEVQGTYTNSKGQLNQTFHHIYDYVNFQSAISAGPEVFQTGPGVVCPGRKQTRAVPILNGPMIYREEIVAPDNGNNAVSEDDIWYDNIFKLVRKDYRPDPYTFPYYLSDRVTEIHDFNTGVAYGIDQTMANCTIFPIANNSFDARVKFNSTSGSRQFYLQFDTPSQFLYIDQNYTFEGQRIVRDMLVDVFISKRSDFPIGNSRINATFEYSFLAYSEHASNNIGNIDQSDTDVPIRLDIITDSLMARYNFYDFAQEHPEIDIFDISLCYQPDDKISFKLTFYGTFDSNVMEYKQIFLYSTITAVSLNSGVSPIRITKPSFVMNTDTAYFTATLVEREPPLARYRKTSNAVNAHQDDTVYNSVGTAADCATYCEASTNFTCNAFDYCASSQTCRLSKLHSGSGPTGSTACDHYSRTLNTVTNNEMDLHTAWINLRNNVIKGAVRIQVALSDDPNQPPTTFTAADITSSSSNSDYREPASTSTLNQFKVKQNKMVPKFDNDIYTGLSVDDCGKKCVGMDIFVCNSFEYEWRTGTCFVSVLHPDDTPNLIKNYQGVDLYIRDYTSHFSEMTGTTVLSSSNTIYQGVYNADQCAKLCLDYTSFPCKSFDYCSSIGTCFLGKQHVLDIPRSGIQDSPDCNHYSRNYIDDFQQYPRKKLSMANDLIISGMSTAQCAKACVEEEAFSCASFSYCGNYSECRLSTASMQNLGQITYQSSAYCDIYTRQYFPDGTAYLANPSKYVKPAPQSSGYSGGAMAGLAFGMVALTLVLVAAIFFIYMKATNKTMDNMSIAFKKMDETDS